MPSLQFEIDAIDTLFHRRKNTGSYPSSTQTSTIGQYNLSQSNNLNGSPNKSVITELHGEISTSSSESAQAGSNSKYKTCPFDHDVGVISAVNIRDKT